jgi:hypothetical protein
MYSETFFFHPRALINLQTSSKVVEGATLAIQNAVSALPPWHTIDDISGLTNTRVVVSTTALRPTPPEDSFAGEKECTIFVACRGTVASADWLTNLQVEMVPLQPRPSHWSDNYGGGSSTNSDSDGVSASAWPSMLVHKGFLAAAETVRTQVLTAVRRAALEFISSQADDQNTSSSQPPFPSSSSSSAETLCKHLVGRRVTLVGLKGAPHLNGRRLACTKLDFLHLSVHWNINK